MSLYNWDDPSIPSWVNWIARDSDGSIGGYGGDTAQAYQAKRGWGTSCHDGRYTPLNWDIEIISTERPMWYASRECRPVKVEPATPPALADLLLAARKELQMSQAEAARRLGVAVNTVRRLEKGQEHNPSLALLRRFVQVYRIRADRLLGVAP